MQSVMALRGFALKTRDAPKGSSASQIFEQALIRVLRRKPSR